jgi:hypothetical protein
MEQVDFKGRTFNLIGRFGHVRALSHVEQDLTGGAGIVVDETTNSVVAEFGPDRSDFGSWHSAVRSQGISLFTLSINGMTREYASDPNPLVNRALFILMSESRASAPVIVNDHGEVVATIARTQGAGATVVWAENGRVDRWRELTWVVIGGEPVALVGTLGGRIQQV